MKNILKLLIIITLVGIFATSCEKQCVCYNRTTGSKAVMYRAYSKSECDGWEEIYQTDIHYNPDGHIIECYYEIK